MTEATLAAPPRPLLLAPAALARWVALMLPLALLAGAYGSEYLGGLVPCEMCWWQRYAHLAALAPAAIAFTAPAEAERSRSLALLAALAIASSGGIGAYHAGVEAGIFEGLTTCTSLASGASTSELLKEIMKTPLVRCDQVQWSMLGVSMAGWNAIVSLAGAGSIVLLTLRKARS